MKKVILALLLMSQTAYAEQEVKVQVLIKEQTEVGEYRDAIYYTVPDGTKIDDFIKEKQSEIDTEKQKRIDNWVDTIKNPPVQVLEEPTEENLIAEKQAILDQKTELDYKISELDTKIIKIKTDKLEKDSKLDVKKVESETDFIENIFKIK